MKKLNEIFEDWELLFTGLGVFVGLPFLASFLLGRDLESLLPELLVSVAVFVLLFALVATGGLKRFTRRPKSPPAGKVDLAPKWTPEDATNFYKYLRDSTALKLAPGEQPMTDEEALVYFKQNLPT